MWLPLGVKLFEMVSSVRGTQTKDTDSLSPSIYQEAIISHDPLHEHPPNPWLTSDQLYCVLAQYKLLTSCCKFVLAMLGSENSLSWPFFPSLNSLMLSTPSFLSLRRGWSYFLFWFCFWAFGSDCVEQTGTLATVTLIRPPGCLNYRCLPPCPDWYRMVVKVFPCKHGKFGVLLPPCAYTNIFFFSTGRTMYSLWVTGKDKIILS